METFLFLCLYFIVRIFNRPSEKCIHFFDLRYNLVLFYSEENFRPKRFQEHNTTQCDRHTCILSCNFRSFKMGCMISKSQKVYSQEKLAKGVEYFANIIDLILRCVMYSISGLQRLD